MIRLRVAVPTALGLLVAGDASAQWSYVNLHPAGATESRAIATTDTQQAGWARMSGAQHAGLWSATAASFVDLDPACATSSLGHATTGTEQAGYAFFGSLQLASLWSGTAASWINLNPTGATASYVLAMSGTEQGGWAVFDGVRAPGIWAGTAASWVDLSPDDNADGLVRDTNGTQQVGYSGAGGPLRASLWEGTPESWVDLSPAGSTGSIAYATIGTEQAGGAIFSGVSEAGTWAGTPESWVSIHPVGAAESQVLGMADTTLGSVQVGYAAFAETVCPTSERATNPHAAVWSGTAGSFVDLHAVLPANYACSETRYVFSSGATLYVAGFAYNSTTAREEAILWINSATTTSTLTSTTTSTTLTSGENPIPMNVFVDKPERVVKFVLRGAFPPPDPDTDNPTVENGVLNITGASGAATYALDAVSWVETSAGFRFRNDVCRGIVRDDLMKVVCKPDTGTLALPETGPVSVALNVGGICYCAVCGGTPRGIPSRVYKRTACPAPVACP
jgi:hypothetical protein